LNRRPPHARDRDRDRYAELRKERKERNRKKFDVTALIRILLLLALVTQCLRVAFASPRLRLQEVKVTGTDRLSTEQVIRLGSIPLGQNIFGVNIVRVSQQMLKDPVIRDAVVTRELPRSLNIELKDREPALQVVAEGAVSHADTEGVLFQRATALVDGLPVLEVPQKALPSLGERLPEDAVRAVWECVRLGGEQKVSIRKIRIDEAGELWLTIPAYSSSDTAPGDLLVRIGRSTDLPEKFRDIHQSLLGWPDLAAKAAYLNVMCAGRPAYLQAPEKAAVEERPSAAAQPVQATNSPVDSPDGNSGAAASGGNTGEMAPAAVSIH
jgi:cell division protein FtsQ